MVKADYSYRLDRDLDVLSTLCAVGSSRAGWWSNVFLVRVRYVRWLLLGWLRLWGLCEFCGVRAGQYGWGHGKDDLRMCYRCWNHFD